MNLKTYFTIKNAAISLLILDLGSAIIRDTTDSSFVFSAFDFLNNLIHTYPKASICTYAFGASLCWTFFNDSPTRARANNPFATNDDSKMQMDKEKIIPHG